MDNYELICSFFNVAIYNLVKENIDTVTSYFSRLPGGRKNNQMYFDFLDVIKNNNFEDVGYPTFLEVLCREGKTEPETREIVNNIVKWKSYSSEQVAPSKKLVRDLIATTVINRANELFPGQPEEYIQYIKNTEIKTTDSDYITVTNFKDIDIDAVAAEDCSKQFISSMDFLNYSFEPTHTVPGSQIIIVSGLPGTGKSLVLTAEALQYASNNGGRGGVHTAYFILGDLTEKDFCIRLYCLLTGKTFAEAGMNVKTAWKQVCDVVGDRLHLIFAPAGKVSADDIVDYAKRHPEIEVFFIDYDSLLAPPKGKGLRKEESLYLSLGCTYDTLTSLSLGMHKLVYIASQPKSFSPDASTESISGAALGDSRRKFEICDCCITAGICQDVSVPMGIINVSKNRRGKKGRYYYVRPNARNMIIPKGVYDYLKQEYAGDTGKILTEAMVLEYIRAYQVQVNQINSNLQQTAAAQGARGGGGPKGKSPFA